LPKTSVGYRKFFFLVGDENSMWLHIMPDGRVFKMVGTAAASYENGNMHGHEGPTTQ